MAGTKMGASLDSELRTPSAGEDTRDSWRDPSPSQSDNPSLTSKIASQRPFSANATGLLPTEATLLLGADP